MMLIEPDCCGQPMIHNSFTGEYECADAYFILQDDGIFPDGDTWVFVDVDALTPHQAERYEHWRAYQFPDGWDEAA